MLKRKQPVRIAESDPDQITMPGVRPVTLGERLALRARTSPASGGRPAQTGIRIALGSSRVDEAPPDFDDPAIEPALRTDLRARLAEILAGRPLSTRRVLLDLQRI